MKVTGFLVAASAALCVVAGASCALAGEVDIAPSWSKVAKIDSDQGKSDIAKLTESLVSANLWDDGARDKGRGDNNYYNDSKQNCAPTPPIYVSCTPEPATWMLTICAIGGVGLMLRRSKKARFDGVDEVAVA